MKTILQSLRIVLVLTVLTGIAYPLVVTGIARVAYHDGRATQLAQKTESARYFWPRPSGCEYATIPSGASNKGPTSADLVKSIAERHEKFGKDAPDELLTASGSGLDPHLSPGAAKYQAPRIAAARQLAVEKVNALIDQLTEGPQLGFLGEPRVNVLALNLALNAAK